MSYHGDSKTLLYETPLYSKGVDRNPLIAVTRSEFRGVSYNRCASIKWIPHRVLESLVHIMIFIDVFFP